MCFKFHFMLFALTISSSQIRIVRSVISCKPRENITNPLQELKKCLFKGYNPKAIPLQKDEKFINVDISFTLEDISFSDRAGEASLFLILEMTWTDPFLTWNPKDYGNLSQIILTQPEASKIWSPSINSDLSGFGSRKNTDDLFHVSKLAINAHGNVKFSELINMNSNCDGDLTEFPFDKYECLSGMLSDNFENEVIFRVLDEKGQPNNSTDLNMTFFTRNHLEITKASVSVEVINAGLPSGGTKVFVTRIYLTIDISRKTGTHVLVFHLPAMGFCLLLQLSLWIAADSLARYVYPLVVIFGAIFQIDAISDLMNMPSHYFSHPVHLVSFYRDLMLLSLLILLESMLSAILWRKKPLHHALLPAYDWLSGLPAVGSLVEHTLFETAIPEPAQGQKQEGSPDFKGPTLRCLAKLIDRVLFCLLVIVLVILYWKLVP